MIPCQTVTLPLFDAGYHGHFDLRASGTQCRYPPSKHAGLVFHSDRGSQYASHDFRNVLTGYGITASMSQRGDRCDNAGSETLFGSLKEERLHGQSFKTIGQAKDETIAWLTWYNHTRRHSTLAHVSPMRFEQNWHTAQAMQASS